MRLTISAARADGSLSPAEQEAIVAHARAVGAEQLVDYEVRNPRPLAEIAAGVTGPEGPRGDVRRWPLPWCARTRRSRGAERIYLAQLAHALGLDPATTARIEKRGRGAHRRRRPGRGVTAQPSGTWPSAATRWGR